MQDVKVLLVQTDIAWGNPSNNYTKIETLISDSTADLIVIPETFSTGFSMNVSEIAEPANGPTTNWMKETAKFKNAVITGSVIIRENNFVYNRLLWATPEGEVFTYDKKHLFGLMGETKSFAPGDARKIFTIKGWRFCTNVCYDLRFPVWCRYQNDYDALLFVANWPAARKHAWKILLNARAIENQSYVIGVNRVGMDVNNIEFGGDSTVIDPLGEIISILDSQESTATALLSSEKLESFREKLPFLIDRDHFKLV